MHISHWVWAVVALILFGAAIAVARRKFPAVVRLGVKFEVGLLVTLFLPFLGAMYAACKGIDESAVPAQLLWLLTVMVGVFVAVYFIRSPRTLPLFGYTACFLLAVLAMGGSILGDTTSWGVQINVLGAF
jgi:hypothetical protein